MTMARALHATSQIHPTPLGHEALATAATARLRQVLTRTTE